MPAKRLIEFLDDRKVKYVKISHSMAYTAQEIAASAHVPGNELAKTVIVKIDGNPAMAVLSASRRVDLERLRDATGATKVELTTEQEFKGRFPDCEPGAMPPFGHLYDMDVYVDDALAEDEEIAFNAGLHTELVRMKFTDFKKLERPKLVKFGTPIMAR
jgi:Ala-tRNA(Pro) deacylase